MKIPELAMNPLAERIIKLFLAPKKKGEQLVNFSQFVRTLSHLAPVKAPRSGDETSKTDFAAAQRKEKLECA
jgi:hypothetical protein